MTHYTCSLRPLAFSVASLLFCTNAAAQQTWGTQAEAFTLNCISSDCSGGATSSGGSTFEPEDNQFQASPATNSVSDARGDGTVTASFETIAPGPATMRQTGSATATATGVVFVGGHTLDLVTYNGPPTTVSILVDLTGEHTGPASGADSGLDGIEGTVYVFRDDNDISFIDADMASDLPCLFECYSPEDSVVVSLEDGTLPDSDALVLALEDGDQFYLYSRFNLTAAGGGSASSLNSFTYSFSNTTGLTSLASGGGGPADADADGVPDSADNCTQVANPAQTDADGDGYGNVCDADIDNNLIVNVADLGLLRSVFFSADAVADFNGDGVVNVTDLGIMRAGFFLAPGPSGIAP